MNDDRLRQLIEMVAGVGVKVVAVNAEQLVPALAHAPGGWCWVHMLGADGQVVPWLRSAVDEITHLVSEDPGALSRVNLRCLLRHPDPPLWLCASGGVTGPPKEPFARAVWREVQPSSVRA